MSGERETRGPSGRAYLENLERRTDEILGELSKVDLALSGKPASADPLIDENERRRFYEETGSVRRYAQNGYVDVHISENEMLVTADFYPPSVGREPIDRQSFAEQLTLRGIVFGIDEQTVSDTILSVNTHREEHRDVPVARGLDPTPAVPAHFRLLERPHDEAPEQGGRRDHRAVSPFVLVKKDEALAGLVDAVAGVAGMTVTGRTVAYPGAKPDRVVGGVNTYSDERYIRAAFDGRLIVDAGKISVNRILSIGGDVNYQTGHIDFPGDVVIGGNVLDGFKVKAEGSVFCSRTLDAFDVDVGGDLNVRMGIIGRRTAKVQVAGNVTSKFIENCYVNAGGSVTVQVGILNSHVAANGTVVTGPRGIICGGEIVARDGVVAVNLGNQVGIDTEIVCGIDHVVKRKLEWIRDKNIDLSLRLQELRKLRRNKTERSEAERRLEASLEEAIGKLDKASQSLIFELDRNDLAEVRVLGSVYSGVAVEIMHARYVVTRMMRSVVFRLDKKEGRILAQAYG